MSEAFNKVKKNFLKLFGPFQRVDRENIYPLIKKRGVEFKDYALLKLQISYFLLLILTLLFLIDRMRASRYALLGGIIAIYSINILYSTVKDEFEGFAAYRDSFLSFYLLFLLLSLIKIYRPVWTPGFPLLHIVVVAVLGTLIIFAYFRMKHSRDYTFGRVISDKGVDLLVKFNYDIASNTKPQTVLIRKSINAKEGDIVKVRVNRGFLSLKGSTPVEIIGVDWS